MLYSVELRNLRSLIAGAKVSTFFETTKFFRNFFTFLYDNSRFMVVFPEFCGWTAFVFTEYPVEIAQIVESTLIAYFCHTLGGIYEHTAGIAESDFYDIVAEIATCMQFEESAECRRTHACYFCQCSQSNLIHIVLSYIVLYLHGYVHQHQQIHASA